MPIDFRCVPPKTVVPDPPRLSFAKWAALFIAIVGGGAALVLYLWPATRPTNTPWFWICTIGYPVLAWIFLWSMTLASAHVRRSEAMAQNQVSDKVELACHAQASKPLEILSHAWCFSADEAENSIDAIVNGRVQMVARPSAAFQNAATVSRWLAIPDKPFYPGNELSEHSRHEVVIDWLTDRLLGPVLAKLEALPPDTSLRIRVMIMSSVKPEQVRASLEAKIRGWFPSLPISMSEATDPLSLFEVDTWADELPSDEVQLLVAVQLRRAISEKLEPNVAEAGVALLLGRPCATSPDTSAPVALHMHRPAIGDSASAAEVVTLAKRWGLSSANDMGIAWNHALSDEAVKQLRSTASLTDGGAWIDLRNTIGDCGHTGSWLGAALATEYAAISGCPQLLITQERSRVIALLCRESS
ncbi:hypothetical protein [Cupriavidus campinensis]